MENQSLLDKTLPGKNGARYEKRRVIVWRLLAWCLGIIERSAVETWSTGANRNVLNGPSRQRQRILYFSYMCSILLMISASIFTMFWYTQCVFHNWKELLRYTSYVLFYWPVITSVQFLSIFANFQNRYGQKNLKTDLTWTNLFSETSFWQKVFNGNFQSTGRLPKIGVCMLFYGTAIFNTVLEIYFWFNQDADCRHFTEYICIVSNISSIYFYCTFCYFLYLNRKALQAEGKRTLFFIESNSQSQSECLKRVQSVFKTYLELRRLLFPWLNVIIFSTSFGITVFLTWRSDSSSGGNASEMVPLEMGIPAWLNHNGICELKCGENSTTTETSKHLIPFDLKVVGEKIMVVLLGLVVVGGMDLRYIWDDFQIKVNMMYSADNVKDIEYIRKFVKHLRTDKASSTVPTFVIPLFGVICGVLSGNHFQG